MTGTLRFTRPTNKQKPRRPVGRVKEQSDVPVTEWLERSISIGYKALHLTGTLRFTRPTNKQKPRRPVGRVKEQSDVPVTEWLERSISIGYEALHCNRSDCRSAVPGANRGEGTAPTGYSRNLATKQTTATETRPATAGRSQTAACRPVQSGA